MSEVTEELVKSAGDGFSEGIKERFATEAKDIASFINHERQQNQGKDVALNLGTLHLETEGRTLHLAFKCKLKKTKDISRQLGDVSLDAPLPGMEEAGKGPKKGGTKKT